MNFTKARLSCSICFFHALSLSICRNNLTQRVLFDEMCIFIAKLTRIKSKAAKSWINPECSLSKLFLESSTARPCLLSPRHTGDVEGSQQGGCSWRRPVAGSSISCEKTPSSSSTPMAPSTFLLVAVVFVVAPLIIFIQNNQPTCTTNNPQSWQLEHTFQSLEPITVTLQLLFS